MTFRRELRPEAIAKRVYQRLVVQELDVRRRPWEELSQGERQRLVAAVHDLVEEHVIVPGWTLM